MNHFESLLDETNIPTTLTKEKIEKHPNIKKTRSSQETNAEKPRIKFKQKGRYDKDYRQPDTKHKHLQIHARTNKEKCQKNN